jgi:hypothetical protein
MDVSETRQGPTERKPGGTKDHRSRRELPWGRDTPHPPIVHQRGGRSGRCPVPLRFAGECGEGAKAFDVWLTWLAAAAVFTRALMSVFGYLASPEN